MDARARGGTGRQARAAAFALVTALVLPVPGAQGGHGGDDPAWLAQAGNGKGASVPVLSGFNLRTVLFDADRYGRGAKRYIAWGTRGGVLSVTRSDDALHWDPYQDVVLRNATGQPVPFLLAETGAYADVVYTGDFAHPFAIYYHVAGATPYAISSIHRALSIDGVTFEQDTPITQSTAAGQKLITETCCTAWNSGSLGPTDVTVNAGGSTDPACGATTIWGCRYVMAYDANDGDLRYVGMAASGDGLHWYGRPSPALSPGASGAWDDNAATLAHIRRTGSTFVMYYAGGRLPDTACFAGQAGCWSIGVATSTSGLTWTKSGLNPATPASLLEAFGTSNPATLWNPQALGDEFVNGDTHSRVFFTRITNAGVADVFMAYTDPGPATPSSPASSGPTLRIDTPKPGTVRSPDVSLSLLAGDTLGSTPASTGLDLSTFTVKVNGVAASPTGMAFTPTLVTAFWSPATHIRGSLALGGQGLHTIEMSIKDTDGNATGVATTVRVDSLAPSTTITGSPTSPTIVVPGGSIGTFFADTVDPSSGAGLQKIMVDVWNPLGQHKQYTVPSSQLTKSGLHAWASAWVAPGLDPHLMLPGGYVVSIRGVDLAGNVEPVAAANTRTVVVV